MWTLDEGLAIIRRIQPETRGYGYHLTLGGGVMNAGQSTKDLDLFFIPLDNRPEEADHAGMKELLDEEFGEGESLRDPHYEDVGLRLFAYKWEYNVDGKRIDVFIMRSHP